MAEFVDVRDDDGADVSNSHNDSDDDGGAEGMLALQSALDKSYRAKLREFAALLDDDGGGDGGDGRATLDELRASLPAEHLAQLEEVLADAEALRRRRRGSGGGGDDGGYDDDGDEDDDDDDELTPGEAEAWRQLQAQSGAGGGGALPADFRAYLATLLPPALPAGALDELLAGLDEGGVLGDMQSLYDELRAFEALSSAEAGVVEGEGEEAAAMMGLDEAAARYAALSARMGALTQALEAGGGGSEGGGGGGSAPQRPQQPSSPVQQQQQQQQQRPPRRQVLLRKRRVAAGG
jgi:hypothetical protein